MICYLWDELDAQLILITFMKKNKDILKNFERRVPQNKQAAKRVYKLNKRAQNNRVQFKFDKNNNVSEILIRKIMNCLSIKNKTKILYSRIKDAETITRKSLKIEKKLLSKSKSPRPCRFCNGLHWDRYCTKKNNIKKKVIKKVKKVFINETKDSNKDIIQEDVSYKAFQSAIFDFDLKSKNE